MIIAGIDEAGLGPALGALCLCASVFSVADKKNSQDTYPPCLWQAYNDITTSKKSEKNNKLLITDSKIAYNAGGLDLLELGALSFISAAQMSKNADFSLPDNLFALLQLTSDNSKLNRFSSCRWYRELKNAPITTARNHEKISVQARKISENSSVKCQYLEAIVLSAEMLNELLDRGLNKSEAVMLQTGTLIRNIYDAYKDEKEIIITVDKQGGRNFYAPFLMDTLGGMWVTPVVESAEISEYTAGNLRIIFRPKADSSSFPVALSSFYAKYLREKTMELFNNFFIAHLPDLEPTAGYHGDAPRFYEKISPVMEKLDIKKEHVWRAK